MGQKRNRKQARRQAQQKMRELDEMYRERMQRTQVPPTEFTPEYAQWLERHDHTESTPVIGARKRPTASDRQRMR